MPLHGLFLVLQLVIAVTAIGGGLMLVVDPSGESIGLPLALLRRSPFRSFLVPGLVLLLVIGLGHLKGAWLTIRVNELAGPGAALLGLLLTGWIAVQIRWIGWVDGLQTIVLALGLLEMAGGPLILGGPARATRVRFLREVGAAGLPAPTPGAPVTAGEIARLPEPARRYAAFMGVRGRPRDASFRARFHGRFRPDPAGPWYACESWQVNTRTPLARIFHIRIMFGGVLPAIARDTYRQGHGRMLVRLADLFTVDDATGPELDEGELVTWLNDAVMIAPTMLFASDVRWSPIDRRAFAVSLTDGDRVVMARVTVNDAGAPVDFSTTNRFIKDPRGHPAVWARRLWTSPIDGWTEQDGRKSFTAGKAVWHLPDLEYPYAEFVADPADLAFNVPPGT